MNRLRELRKEKKWRQVDLAKLLNTEPQSVGRYETEDRGMDVATIHKVCDIFGCTADYLLCRSQLATPELSEEEEALLQAFRRADEDRREIVRTALAPFREDPAEESAI